jgi:hypothetical protein
MNAAIGIEAMRRTANPPQITDDQAAASPTKRLATSNPVRSSDNKNKEIQAPTPIPMAPR